MVLDPPPAEQYRHIAPREIQKERSDRWSIMGWEIDRWHLSQK
jgi:hypothetical protein